MLQHELRAPRGARRPRKRIGRGNASGHGTYAGKGMKGQQARAGYSPKRGFEGGQTPLIRRLPRRRGFRNPFREPFLPVNLRALSQFPAKSEVTPEALREAGIIRSLRKPIKLLGDGEITVALTVRAHRVSAPARAKIEAAGGTVEELTPLAPIEERRRNRKTRRTPAKAPAAEATTEEEDDSGRKTSESAETTSGE